MLKGPERYYFSKEEPVRGCLLALRNMILDQDPDITETLKWGMPCFCYRKKIFCYLWTDKKTDDPYILLAEGRHLDHAELEAGNRSRMKIFRVKPDHDLPASTIQFILNQGLDLYRTGTIKIR